MQRYRFNNEIDDRFLNKEIILLSFCRLSKQKKAMF